MTSTAEIGNLRVRLGIDSAEFANGVRAVQGNLATLSNSLKIFATGAAAITLFNQAVNALHDVADLGDVAEAIGITAEQIQVYSKMAEASGTSSDIMMRGLQSIAEQSTDTKSKLAELFDANGLTLAGKNMNQVILDFMDLLKAAKTPAEQLAIATGVLGDKVGRQLVESLRTGSSGWTEAFNQMKKDGWYLADEQVKAAQEIETKYNQVLSNLTKAWQKFVVLVAEGINAAVNPNMGSSANKFRSSYGLGAAQPAKAPTFSGAPGKGDLPNTVNSTNGYSVSQPTVNPYTGGGSSKKSSKSAADDFIPGMSDFIPGMSIDDIYGYGEAFSTLWKDMEAGIPTTNALDESLQSMANTMVDELSTAIVGLIDGTVTLEDAFKNMAESMVKQLENIAAEIIKSEIFKLLGMLAGALVPGNAGFSFGGMMFGGVYADGGTLGSGKWGIAGEAGPEIIHGPATITPMDKMPGGSAQMNVSINNYSNANVQARQGSDGRLTVDIMEKELAARVARGGSPLSAGLEKGYGLRRAGR